MDNTVANMEQIDLNHLRVFLKVVECKSFTAASEHLTIPKSTLSRAVSSLEDALGVQLFYRTTRKIEMTAAGRSLYANSQNGMTLVEKSLANIREQSQEVGGVITVTAVEDIGVHVLAPIISDFGQMYPKVRVNLIFDSNVLDLVGKSVDVAVRVGKVTQTSYRARKVGKISFVLVASPHYIDMFNGKITLDSLPRVDFIAFSSFKIEKVGLTLKKDKKSKCIKLVPKYESTSTDAMLKIVSQGGVALLPDFLVEDAIKSGVVSVVCNGWATPAKDVSIVTPLHRKKSRAVEVFNKYLYDRLNSL